MSKHYSKTSKILLPLFLLFVTASTSWSDTILDMGSISATAASGGGILGGTSTFNLAASDIPDVELLANFFVIDAGIDIVVNGTSLFPQYEDLSNFGPEAVFTGTGESSGGGINLPFSPNDINLPRLTVTSTAAGSDFTGATFPNSTSTVPYTPVFTTEDFASLLQQGNNTIEFFVLNNFQGANLDGDFTVTLKTAAVPEPSSAGLVLLAGLAGLAARRRR